MFDDIYNQQDTQSAFVEGLIEKIKSMSKRIDELEALDQVTISVKTTTGNPATGVTGQFSINTFDNKAYIYADGDWREIASW